SVRTSFAVLRVPVRGSRRGVISMDVYTTIVNFFREGGVFMYPIAIVLALGVAIAIERWVYLTVTTAKNKALWNAITPYLKSGNLSGAMQVTAKSKAAIGQIMTYGLNRVRSARRREDVEQAMEESLMEVMPRLEKRSEEHTSELQSRENLVCRLLLEKKK